MTKSKVQSPRSNVQSPKTVAYIGLGSNLGDARRNVLRAIERLQEFSDVPLRKSTLWKSTPVGCPPGSPDFVNAVVALVPCGDETPESLLKKLQALEKEFGRKPKKIINEPRLLDLDLIAFGDESRETQDLILPHPRAHQRRFVLQPLAEIAPAFNFPGQSKKVAELLDQLPPDEEIERLAP